MARYEDLPYRTCVGMMLINPSGLVFIGRRAGGIEHVDETHVWQMPQGGVDPGEETWPAALRELYEETNVRSASLIAEAPEWLAYDLPDDARNRFAGRYRGQTQRWFLFRFEGEDAEIDIHHPAGGAHKPEFVEWRWEPIRNLPSMIIPFKRPVYDRVVKEFSKFAK